MQLRRWHRIGIVISVVWIVASSFYERNKQVEAATNHAVSMGKLCLSANQKATSTCMDEQDRTLEMALKPNWTNVAFVSLGPLLVAWLLIALGRKTYTWVRAGAP